MSTILQFLDLVSDFIANVLNYDIIPGVKLFTVLFYNLLLLVVFTSFTRKG